MFKAHPKKVSRMALAAALLCSSGAAFAVDVNPAPAPAPDESNFFKRLLPCLCRRVGHGISTGRSERASRPADPPPAAVAAGAREHAAHALHGLAARRRGLYRRIDAQCGR